MAAADVAPVDQFTTPVKQPEEAPAAVPQPPKKAKKAPKATPTATPKAIQQAEGSEGEAEADAADPPKATKPKKRKAAAPAATDSVPAITAVEPEDESDALAPLPEGATGFRLESLVCYKSACFCSCNADNADNAGRGASAPTTSRSPAAASLA